MVRIELKVTPKNFQQAAIASMVDAGMKFEGNVATIDRRYDPRVQRIQLTIFGDKSTSCDYEVFDETTSVRPGSLRITEGRQATKVIRFYMTKRPQ